MTINAYSKCPVCGGKGKYWGKEQISGNAPIINTPRKCGECNGSGWILTSKLKVKPLYDKWGNPIDKFGRVVKTPEQEPDYRRKRRELEDDK